MASYDQLMEGARRADAAGDEAGARRFLELARGARAAPAPEQPRTNIVEQIGTGTSEGIADTLGMPVDLMTKGINFGARRLGLPEIQKPVGGSESIRAFLDPVMSDVEPQTAAQRIGRRVGDDLGGGAVVAPVAGISSLGALGLNAASDAASGLAGGVTSEVTDNPIANVVASLLGAGGVVAGSRAARSGPKAPSMEKLRRDQGAAYADVEASPTRLTPQATGNLAAAVDARMQSENMDPYLHPRAARTTVRIGELDQPTIYEVEQRRRLAGRDVAGSSEASERELGVAMKSEIDAFLGGLRPQDLQGGSADEAVEALKRGRDMTQRIKKAEAIDEATYKAVNRAATSGTGGNEINAIRQNVRSILDNPKARRGYSRDEVTAMEEIVRGTPTINAARMLGRFSPTSGMLSASLGGGLGAGAISTGSVLMAAPPAIGFVAKAIGEKLTRGQIDNLSEIIRNGGVAPAGKAMSDGEKAVIRAMMLKQGEASLSPQH